MPTPDEKDAEYDWPQIPQSEQRCVNCRFWTHKDGWDGLCRKHAPAPGPLSEVGWPRTNAAQWCGQWEPRERDDD